MVQIEVVRSSNVALVKSQSLVAVFVGGTAGIGEFTIRALAATHSSQGKGLRVYIVGRKAAAAKKTIADCSRICPGGQFRFVQAEDVALLKDVDRVCAEITRIENDENANGGTAKIDILVMSQAYFTFDPRKETKEGLDMVMSLLYYSRMRFIMKLLPLLLASPLPAHIVSIYAAGLEGKLFPEDLSLRDPKHYSFANVRSHVTYMKTFFMEGLAERHRGRLSLVHIYPGLVVTDAFKSGSNPFWFKFIWFLVAPFAPLFAIPGPECGQRILFLATSRFPARPTIDPGPSAKDGGTVIAMGTDGKRGSGAYAVKSDGETVPAAKMEETYKKLRKEGWAEKVWKHTTSAFDEIEAGNVFTS